MLCCALRAGSCPPDPSQGLLLWGSRRLKALVFPGFLLILEFPAACFEGSEITESLWALFYLVSLEMAGWVHRWPSVCFTSLHWASLGCVIFPQFWSGNMKFDKTWNLWALSPPYLSFFQITEELLLITLPRTPAQLHVKHFCETSK